MWESEHQSVFSAGTLGPLSHLQVPMKAPTVSPPQPLSMPRLVQPQELLTKAACGNEGCVEGGVRRREEGREKWGGVLLGQMAGEVSQLLAGQACSMETVL
ncbi:hypothetical protein MHYP_G00112480 [Metynnis hypsauchen]